MIDEEEWRLIAESDGYYEVSSLGRVRRIRTAKHAVPGHVLTPSINRKGYACFVLCLGSLLRRLSRTAHSLVAEAFIGPRPANATVNHKDANKLNNAVLNLEYVSNRDNILHAVAFGLRAPKTGELNGAHKLTEDDVRTIRSQHAAGATMYRLAKTYGVYASTINCIVNRRSWRHVA